MEKWYVILHLRVCIFWHVVLAPPSSPVAIRSSSLKTVSSPLRGVRSSVLNYMSSRSFDDKSMLPFLFSFYLNTDFLTQFRFTMVEHAMTVHPSSSTTMISAASRLGLWIATASLVSFQTKLLCPSVILWELTWLRLGKWFPPTSNSSFCCQPASSVLSTCCVFS